MFLSTLNELFISIEGTGPSCCTYYVYTKALSGEINTTNQSLPFTFSKLSVFLTAIIWLTEFTELVATYCLTARRHQVLNAGPLNAQDVMFGYGGFSLEAPLG